ncbi:MAG: hypothetical protein GAK30_00970 [Paracidovorax wautersii]|uniref:DUF403 domain-containing protein n=1 Tax=Paracidovorax wautersii TaxID=1177982 RepID=A0A7V8JRH9_9BURK|nr:MAG: hypothetical protein GAK30_00970 [Paracidovorax wautersii]
MLDVNYQTSLLPQSASAAEDGWRGALNISELMPSYVAKYGAEVTPSNVMDFMIRDENNPSSIASCLRAARENARAVRGSLTTEAWETANQTWLELRRLLREDDIEHDPAQFFEWVKFRSHLSRGVTLGTMLQDESFQFMRIGTFLERADNTARLIDVKFHAQPEAGLATQSQSQSSLAADGEQEELAETDFYHWSAILRSVSAFEIYRKVYRDVIKPERVAELLILRADMPRSLLSCLIEVDDNLKVLANDQSGQTQRYSGKLRADLQFASIQEILSSGLHGFLTQFLDRVNNLGSRISKDFLIPVID